MLLRHPGEVGIAIDHWAALVLEGDEYSVLSVSGKPGSVVAGEGGAAPRFSAGEGAPGIWLKEVVDGAVRASLVAPTGRVCDILRPATAIVSRAIVAGIWVSFFQELTSDRNDRVDRSTHRGAWSTTSRRTTTTRSPGSPPSTGR